MEQGKMHLVMPMGGKGSRFAEKGFDYPKPLIEIYGKPFFYWSVRSIEKFVLVKDIIFVVLKEHVEKFHIDTEIQNYFPEAIIHVIPEVLNGAVLTCIEALKEIEDELPILFNDCDHLFRSTTFNEFCNGEQRDSIDGALLTFRSRDDKYGYVKLDTSGNVCGTAEKRAVSCHAICGAYYFRNANIFYEAAQQYLNDCDYQEYYLSGVYNAMAEMGQNIVSFETDFHIPYGTPEEYRDAQKSKRFEELI